MWNVVFEGPSDTLYEVSAQSITILSKSTEYLLIIYREDSLKLSLNSQMTILTILLKWDLWQKCSIQIVTRTLYDLTNIFTVYSDGRVCISILHPPGTDQYNTQETAAERWRPIHGVESIILSVISMLNDPNIDSPANIDAAIEYRDNIDSYKKKVRKLT